MKLFDRKRIIIIGAAIILGLIFGAFLLHEQTGKLGSTEFIALGATFLIAVTVSYLIVKKGNQ